MSKILVFKKSTIAFWIFITILIGYEDFSYSQTEGLKNNTEMVNVFLGSSGDHGQLSPAASSPFGLLSIGPQTYPTTHMGYEYLAKQFLGFTHNRLEGVGCMGSGGNILIKPFLGHPTHALDPLIKLKDKAGPGFYQVEFNNGIKVNLNVAGNFGVHHYVFPNTINRKYVYLDLQHAFNKGFIEEHHVINGNSIKGWIDSKTTCNIGVFRTYYYIEFDTDIKLSENNSRIIGELDEALTDVRIKIGVSSVNEDYAKETVMRGNSQGDILQLSNTKWSEFLNKITIEDDSDRKALFYSLLYRGLQSPFLISESNGAHRKIDGSLAKSKDQKYNGWAIWDNYKTQLPLLALIYPNIYQNIVTSIEELYLYGKKDFSTKKEPSNTVRTEHAIVVLLDAHNKGFKVNFGKIIDSLVAENNRLDYKSPDKALESAYDDWALAQVFKTLGKRTEEEKYLQKAAKYKDKWISDFKNLDANDVDRMSARKMYQGTIRQYRWAVPFDVQGLIDLIGSEGKLIEELDDFFDNHYYNRTNEPDLMAHNLYNATSQPWKAQSLIHQFAVDTVVNHYFNDNSRGIGAVIDRVYKNQPNAFIRTMDDDAGAMSSWFIWASLGLQPAHVGSPVYYLSAPLFKFIRIPASNKKFLEIKVKNFNSNHAYIKSVKFNGKILNRNWISHKELLSGGILEFETSESPNKTWGIDEQWISNLNGN